MRLFVAAWPPADVVEALATALRLPRADPAGVRWARPASWHVTLRFLGEVPDPEPVVAAVSDLAAPARVAVLGPATATLGRGGVLVVPVAGLDDLADAVVARTAALGEAPPERWSFVGHLTLARAPRGGGGVDLRRLAGAPVEGTWPIDAIRVVRSRLSRSGAEYEELARLPLAPPPAS